MPAEIYAQLCMQTFKCTHCATPSHATSRHATSRHVTSRHIIPCCVAWLTLRYKGIMSCRGAYYDMAAICDGQDMTWHDMTWHVRCWLQRPGAIFHWVFTSDRPAPAWLVTGNKEIAVLMWQIMTTSARLAENLENLGWARASSSVWGVKFPWTFSTRGFLLREMGICEMIAIWRTKPVSHSHRGNMCSFQTLPCLTCSLHTSTRKVVLTDVACKRRPTHMLHQ